MNQHRTRFERAGGADILVCPNAPSRIPTILILCLSIFVFTSQSTAQDTPTIGMEGRRLITLPGTRLEAKPFGEKTPLALRIASATETSEGIAYDLRYMGFVPGKHDLKNYLVRADGSSMANLPSISVEVVPVLPPDHNGRLVPEQAKPLPFLGGYKLLMAAAITLWLLLLIPILMIGRQRKARDVEQTARPLTLADRLRPLVEQAAAGKLPPDRQAELERLLLWHWRQKLNLADTDAGPAILQLRQHSEAGALLRALETWLHRPPGATQNIDVAAVLAPYKNIPAETPGHSPRHEQEPALV
jgi:hypothetical protein